MGLPRSGHLLQQVLLLEELWVPAEVVAACARISSVSLLVGLGVVLIFQFISNEGKVGGRLLPCLLPGTVLILVGMCSTKIEPGLGRSQSALT